jgi:hypothetical protein
VTATFDREIKMKIRIEYDGKYPNLCSGHLIVIITTMNTFAVKWDFGKYCLESGGIVSFTEDWEESVWRDKWSISKWPTGFPDKLKEAVLAKVNEAIPMGCCGGCV